MITQITGHEASAASSRHYYIYIYLYIYVCVYTPLYICGNLLVESSTTTFFFSLPQAPDVVCVWVGVGGCVLVMTGLWGLIRTNGVPLQPL